MIHAEVTDRPLSVVDHESMVSSRSSGAVVSFSGVVRDHDHGRRVDRLGYEAHPGAAEVLRTVAAEVAETPGVAAIAVSHRIGDLAIGDAALVAAVAGPHRAAVFEACARLVDEVKARLPVWKHQFFTDGTDEWVNCP
ncbi:molybdopterin synthase catalytic subunit [Stackebrandtia albiflava]|uniref:Molybdopterin synthase catalytic subunit n=1 Tax=Stackebrandtia albiflava TaxID=406432 RepID=A0A562V191_9ACTN|nr:molybdenum cofactor biosynthesis protein MoaE [Stackebrandtia albiflava]TWJ11644.1 molybdopterin synthase catalytic subunit [Stackebrandtia albiflava]